jgi:hypothetical protein
MTTFGLRTRLWLMAGLGKEPIVAIAAEIVFKKSRRSIQLLQIIIVSKTLFLIFLPFIAISRDLPFNFVIGIPARNTVNNTIIGASIQGAWSPT